MAEYFDDIKFEVETSDGVWTDITSDVQVTPPPRWNRGIMGNQITDRVGSPGYLTFDLDNSSHNSAATQSYYSPGSSDCWADWRPGLAVRLSFTIEGQTFYKFYGHIMPDGIQADPGVDGPRKVHVRAGDFMALSSFHEVNGLTIQSNLRIDEAVPLVLAGMAIQPLATSYETGTYTFPTVFDNVRTGVTTAISEFQKLANSELGAIYVIGDCTGGETLRVEDKTYRNGLSGLNISKTNSQSDFLLKEDGDYLLLETGDKIILNETQSSSILEGYLSEGTGISYGKNIINRIRTTTYPRKVDTAATTVLFTLQEEFTLGPSETKNGFECRYTDPSGGNTKINGTDMRVPTTDDFYAETSDGVNATSDITLTANYFSDSVVYDLVNNVAANRIVKTLKAVGKGVYLYDPVSSIYDDTGSQTNYGVFTLSYDMRYQNDPTVGDGFASQIISYYSSPKEEMDKGVIFANRDGLSIYTFLQFEPGTEFNAIQETVTGYGANNGILNGYEAEIKEGMYVWWYPVVINSQGFI